MGFCIAYAGSSETTSVAALSEMRQRELAAVAQTLARAMKTLTYVGVGVQTTASMYACDCLWFKVGPRPADEAAPPLLEPVPHADCGSLRERLQDTPRAN